MLRFRVPWLLLVLFGGIGFTERASAEDRQVWFVSGQTIHLTEELVVGLSGQSNGVVLVEGGILRCPDAVIGRERFAANNFVWVGGAGSRWEVADSLTIGMEGSTNRAVVRNGGQLEVGDLRLGWGLNTMSADNALLLRDAGTRAVVNRELILGSGGNRVEIGGGATLVTLGRTSLNGVGSGHGGLGSVMNLYGSGTAWESHSEIVLFGWSRLEASDGARVFCPGLSLDSGYSGLILSGVGTRLEVAGRMESRGGGLVVSHGAELVSEDGWMRGGSGSTGDPPSAVSVLSGEGTLWQCRSNLWLMQQLEVRDAARLVVTNAQRTGTIYFVGKLELAGGTVIADTLDVEWPYSVLWGSGTVVGAVTNRAGAHPYRDCGEGPARTSDEESKTAFRGIARSGPCGRGPSRYWPRWWRN